ncbi:MAG: GGDEF domain-containing protein [Burkholderiaceae bacterium]|nr:GGDEF domain-containing protein [Burkholderiaceae bacterium]
MAKSPIPATLVLAAALETNFIFLEKLCGSTDVLRRGIVTLCIAFCILLSNSAVACDGAQNIRLLKPVEISAQQRAEFQAMPPLKVVAVGAPPMARYDEESQTYNGIGIDVLCFITKELGLSFEITPGRDQTVADKIRQVQEGHADVFIPLSHSSERAKHGLFTTPYYKSHYAVIARHGRSLSIRSTADLANYQVGFVEGVSLQPILQSVVPAAQLHPYNQTSSDGLFQDVLDGVIDIAVFNQQIFTEKRYHQEFFDLDIVHTLHEHPRAYSYYFSQSPEHQRTVAAFDRYLAAIDVSAAVMIHEQGERHFLERYMAQRDQRVLLQTASVAAALLALISYLGLLRYRRLTKLLAERNTRIQQHQQALQDANQKLQTLSWTDSLTGLSNRRHFDEMLAYEYGRYLRTGSPLSLLIIDVDHFKHVNDHYGHAVGDDYLRAIARVLENSIVRSTDLIARYGGEEFTCLLTDITPEGTRKVAERINRGIVELGLPNPSSTLQQLTLSIGAATVIKGDPGVQAIFAQADTQLYTAKKMGRNQIRATVIGLSQ